MLAGSVSVVVVVDPVAVDDVDATGFASEHADAKSTAAPNALNDCGILMSPTAEPARSVPSAAG